MSIQLYPSIAKIKRNGVYENLPGFVPETGSIATQQMIATSESSATAQYVHNKGEYFRLNDTLYQAIVKINVGDSIVVGTNCEVAVLGNDLTHVANSIAAYELGIASSSHNTGDYFMVGETLYVATSDIQVGDTISTSTNCRLAVVGDELSGLKTATDQKFTNIGYTEIQSVNLLNPDELEPGRITSSSSVPLHTGSYDTDYRTTGFMSVEAGEKYGFYYRARNNIGNVGVSGIWAYDSDKTALQFLGSLGFNTAGTLYVTAPNGAAYIRASISTAAIDAYSPLQCSKTDGTPPNEISEYTIGAYLEGYLKEAWIGKKWVVVGDSLTENNVTTTKHYFDYIADISGAEIANMGVGGTGYCRGYDSNRAFYQRISAVPTDADVVTVFGSGNDMNIAAMQIFDGKTWTEALGTFSDTGTDTICGCVNTFLDNYFAVMPTAPIGIIAPTPWMSYPTSLLSNNRFDDYTSALKQICEYRGVSFLDLYHHSNLRPENEANRNACYYNGASVDGNGDGVHPNELGHKIIAPKIYEFVKTMLLN